MNNEKELERKLEQYQELAKENKSVDVAALMLNALGQAQRDELDGKKKRWAYIVSVALPPLGLLYAIRYYFSAKSEGKKVALWCIILTLLSLALAWGLTQMMFSSVMGSGIDLKQIQSINPEDLKALLQP